MTTPLFAAASSQLQEVLRSRAILEVSLGRGRNDNYVIDVVPLVSGGNEAVSSPSDLLPLLPNGSLWSPALGWRSIVGLSIILKGLPWVVFGVEGTSVHASRGASALFCGFLFRLPLDEVIVQSLRDVADKLVPYESRTDKRLFGRSSAKVPRSPLNVRGRSSTWEKHRRVEYAIIQSAADAYTEKYVVLFRTLLLSEGDVWADWERTAAIMSVRPRLQRVKTFTATVPKIRETFSKRCRMWLQSCDRLLRTL